LTREELIAKYVITENGLQLLINELLALPDSHTNRTILQNALKGKYSELTSIYATAGVELQQQLATAGKDYNTLLLRSYKGTYIHHLSPQRTSSGEQSFDPRLFVNSATASTTTKDAQTSTPPIPYPHVNLFKGRPQN
jgi:hypothetical protein